MQSDHETDELQALLREEYGAPPLDKQFSTDLVARLKAEISSLPSPSLTPALAPAKSQRTLLTVCLGVAAVAASIIAVVLIFNQPPKTEREVARRYKTDYNRLTQENVDSMAVESESARENERLESLSDRPRTLSLHESLRETMPESQRLETESNSESKPYSEARTPRTEDLAREERKPTSLSILPSKALSAFSAVQKEWPNVSATAAMGGRLYIADSGRLYEVDPADGSRRSVGNDHWPSTAVMTAAGNHLYLVSDNQLYQVDPKTGVRQSVGKPDWTNTTAIITSGDKLYMVSNGLLHWVDPKSGSHEVLHSQTGSPNESPAPKP